MPGLKPTGCNLVFLRAGLSLCGLVIALQFSGCQVSNTWFQMDSNSPMPFFGFDIALPRRTAMRTESLEHPGLEHPGNVVPKAYLSNQDTPSLTTPVKLRRSVSKKAAGDVVHLSFE